DKRWTRLMTQQIQSAEVEIVTDLGTSRVTLGDILNMQVGDVIPFAIPETVTAKVDNVPVMDCSYGILNGQYALRVEKLLTMSQNESTQGEQHG
ncbi:MAG TPA: flagellar motor switch protein FliM, partial [Betaproteobacteria bacterium]|nr:flagellar motor switch protein FliM [Betaproteobacteria bacterium]